MDTLHQIQSVVESDKYLKKNLKVILQDTLTGEVYDTYEMCSPLASVNVSEPTSREQREYYENLNAHKAMSKTLGGFVMVLYFNNEKLYGEELNLSKSTVSRLLMLATYMDFENRIVKEVPKTKNQAKEVEYMKRKDIQNTLGLKARAFSDFITEITNAGILIKDDKGYYLSVEYFRKGSIAQDNYFSKMYVETVRQVYLSTPVRKHSTLSYIFQLMPYVHWKTNYIVKDRMCGLDEIETMDLKEICGVLGLETTKDSVKKMKKELLSFKLIFDNEQYYLFNMMTQSSEKGKRTWFVVNPLLYNSMTDYNDFQEIAKALWVN